jgi:PAS domain S-box-containing protein
MPDFAQQLKTLIENSAVAAAMFDMEMRYMAWSRHWRLEYHLGEQDLLGRSHYEVFPEISAEWKAVHRRCLAGAAESKDDDPFPRANGQVDVVRWSVQPWRNEANQVGGLIMFTDVVTEYKRVAEALRISERNLGTIFRESPVALAVSDFETGRILEANTALLCLLRASSRDQVVGRTSIELGMFTPDDRLRLVQSVRSQGRLEGFVTTMNRLDGEEFLAELCVSSYADRHRRILLSSLVDISERKRAEAERTRLIAAIEQAAETIVITDASGKIVYANPAFEKTSGYTIAEALGENPRILKSGKQAADFYRQLWQTLGRGEVWRGRFENQRKDGTLYLEDATISPVLDESGRIVNYIGVKLDVTREAQLQAQLLQAQKMESIGRLAGGVAHDFNNLLTVINGYSDMALADLPSDQPLRGYLEEIRAAGERAAGLTRQLLAFSRKQILLPEVLNLNHVLENMQSMLRRLVGEDIEVRLALSPHDSTVRADLHQLEQVILNLSVNARDAMPRGGRLLIETGLVMRDGEYPVSHPDAKPGRYVVLTVSDTGVGMDRETQERIFEPFFTSKGIGQGTGLGLAMVQGIVAQSGGYIDVYSELGHGTTFKIGLPEVGEGQAERSEAPGALALTGSETILVVEDQSSVREYVVSALRAYGYHVVSAASPVEALAISKHANPRIEMVLSDVVMPQMSGRELVDRLRVMQPEIKVLFMSGYTENVVIHYGVLGGREQFIQKPFKPDELARKVRDVFGRP